MESEQDRTFAQEQSVTDRYWRDLVHCGYGQREYPIVARFGRLSRLNIVYLFNELIKIKADIRLNDDTNEEQMDRLTLRLHQYVDALRDYQYLDQLPALPSTLATRQRTELERTFPSLDDPTYQRTRAITADHGGVDRGKLNYPFDNSYLMLQRKQLQKSDLVREFLRKHLARQISWSEEEKATRRADYSQGIPPDIYSPTLDRIARFLVGLMGGAWLVVPLIIMAVHSSLVKTMITVCTAVVLFSLAVSLAAVLVVFVGTSTGKA